MVKRERYSSVNETRDAEVRSRKTSGMTDCYEAPQVIELGKAEDVILDQKQPGSMDAFVPFATDAVTIDDFDEYTNGGESHD